VIVPVLAGPVLAWTEYETVPPPFPFAPDVTLIHESLLTAVQVHPAVVVTSKFPFPPAAEILELVGAKTKLQPLAWLIVKVWPPAVIEPFLAGPVFASTLYETEPLPFPFAPDVTCIQGSLVAAVHVQPSPVVTLKLPAPPPAEKFAPVGVNVYVQPLAWVIVKIFPPAVMVPLLAGPVLACTEYETVPFPLPFAPPVTVIQGSLLWAVQTHPAPVMTIKSPEPPEAGKFAVVDDKPNEHGMP
jgi:hypothetical protein